MDQEQIYNLLKNIFPFRGLDEEQLRLTLKYVKQYDVPAGQVLYEQSNLSDGLYMLGQGAVQLMRGGERLWDLSDGDLFGLETVQTRGRYAVTARAATASTLLVWSPEDLDGMLGEVGELTLPLQLLLEGFQLALNIKFSWRDPDEEIYYIDRRHPLFMWVKVLPWAGLAVAGLVLALSFGLSGVAGTQILVYLFSIGFLIAGGITLWNYFDWTNDYSIVTNRRVVFQERVVLLYDSRVEAPLDAVLSSARDSSQWGRWLHYGDVIMKTFTGTLILPQIRYPEYVLSMLEDRRTRFQGDRARMQRKALETLVRKRIGKPEPDAETPVESPPAAPKTAASQTIEPGRIAHWLSEIAQMRSERDGVITYRTHWIMLVRNIFWPAIFLIALFFVILSRVLGSYTFVSIEAVLGVGLVIGLIGTAVLAYQYFDWYNDQYIITQDQIIDIYKKPLGTEDRKVAPIKNIQTVEFERLGFIGLVFNFGTVYIRVGDTKFTFDNVFNPSEVQRTLFKRMAEYTQRERANVDAAERTRIADFIEVYHKMNQPPSTDIPDEDEYDENDEQ